MKIKLILIKIIVLNFIFLTATDVIEKTSGTPDFTNNISAKAFDKYTGTFYVGIAGTSSSNNDILKACRNDLVFTELGTVVAEDSQINLMDIISNSEETKYIAFQSGLTPNSLSVITPEPLSTTILLESSGTGNNNIVDATGNAAIDSLGNAFTLIRGSNINYIFLRVPNLYFQDSGILAYEITDGPALTRRGEPTNNFAAKLDNQKGAAGDGSFLRDGSASLSYVTPPMVNDMYWDSKLETLFIAGSIDSTGLVTAFTNNYHMAISKVKLDGNGNLIISDIIPLNVNATAANDEAIFASNTNNATDRSRDPKILKIRTMHTSTGRTYLIINGTTGELTEVGNIVYALQYNPEGELFPDDPTKSGLICQNDTNKTQLTNNFEISGGPLAGQSLDGENVGSLIVGRENTPWQSDTPVSDIQVIGDTVYVSLGGVVRDENNNPGLWASQALFDKDGVIIGWTKWERVFPDPVENIDDRKQQVYFFSVDAKNNKIWKVTEGDREEEARITSVERTTWITDPCSLENNPLVKVLHKDFSDICTGGCTCVLDLPTKTPGIYDPNGNNKSNSFALFGGYEKVAFSRTVFGNDNEVVVDFSGPDNYKLTSLKGSGAVRCLGFSRNIEDDSKGYFFAGTDTGLWIYANTNNGEGFNGEEGLENLITAPFDGSFSWQQFSTNIISGPVSTIKSDGSAIYLIEQDIKSSGEIITKLWKIEIDDDIATMQNNAVIIAQSGLDEIPKNTIFTGLGLLTNLVGQREHHQGIISSNLGLFQSTKALYDLNEAGNNASGTWINIENKRAYHSLYSPKRVPTILAQNYDGFNSNVFANAFAQNECQRKYFQNSSFYQFSANLNDDEIAIENTKTLDEEESIFYTNRSINSGNRLDYIDRTLNFWTDGGRRFFITFNPEKNSCYNICEKHNMISSLPFDADEWNMNGPYQDDSTTGKKVFWIENISGIGSILAGTTTGVIALQ